MLSRGALGSALVVAGGLVTQVLPWSSPVATQPVVAALRASHTAHLVAVAVVVAGLVLLGSAWLQLLAAVRPGTGQPVGVRLRTVHLATVAWSAPLLLAPPLFSRDGWSYAAQGALTHLGLSPYIWTPSILDGPVREGVDPLWWWTPAPYGPAPLAWGSFVAGLTDDPWLMVVGYRVLALVGLALLAWAVPRLARHTDQDPARASAIALACPLTVLHGVGGVHNDLAMAGLMAAALAVAVDGGWAAGATLAGAAAAVKVPGGLVAIAITLVSLPLLAATGPRLRRLLAVAVIAGGVVVAWGAALGVGTGWVSALGTPGLVRTPLAVSTQLGVLVEHVARWVGLDLVSSASVDALRWLGLLVAVGYAAREALLGRTGDPAYAVRSAALLATAFAVLGPAVHAWYLLWPLPFLAACRWSRPVELLVRDAVLVLGLVAPLDSWVLGVPLGTCALGALVVATLVRRRTSATQAATAPRSSTAR